MKAAVSIQSFELPLDFFV